MTKPDINFMHDDHACSIYNSFGFFINKTYIPQIYEQSDAVMSTPILGKTLLVCYEDIGSVDFIGLKHLYTEDNTTFELCRFVIDIHTGEAFELQKSERQLAEIDIQRFVQTAFISLRNSSRGFVYNLRHKTDVLNSSNLIHPRYDFSFERLGEHKTFAFYTADMYNLTAGSC